MQPLVPCSMQLLWWWCAAHATCSRSETLQGDRPRLQVQKEQLRVTNRGLSGSRRQDWGAHLVEIAQPLQPPDLGHLRNACKDISRP